MRHALLPLSVIPDRAAARVGMRRAPRPARGRTMTSAVPAHRPVLLTEVMAALAPGRDEIHVDGTFGAGGYTRAILDTGAQVLAFDRDPTAIRDGRALETGARGRLTLIERPFSRMAEALGERGIGAVDGIVLDIGVSSMQLDRAERGFSFRFDGPLDMRMGAEGDTAADLIARLPEKALADLIYTYGEERLSRPIARAIVAARAEAPITTTAALASLLSRVVRTKPGDIHPATRTFQALRIAVNDELGELSRALDAAEGLLRPGGRLVVVTFHSLEDRIVKQWLAARTGRAPTGSRHAPAGAVAAPTFEDLTRKPVEAGAAELADNPRARSAKLRAARRTTAPIREVRP